MSDIKKILQDYPQYREQLFNRGYLITNGMIADTEKFPFYGNFRKQNCGRYQIYTHKNQRCAIGKKDQVYYVLIGNCINPFDGEIDEKVIIDRIASFGTIESEEALRFINCLTGNFLLASIQGKSIRFLSDPAGMLFGCYGVVNDSFYLSTHAQMIADIEPLTKSEYIQRLEKYRFFNQYGAFFPGDLTQYQELHRILQNHIMIFDGKCVQTRRFFPSKKLLELQTENEYELLLGDVIQILNRTMACYARKYRHPAVSMTGGMDSKTTLACANGLYDRFFFYSYNSMAGDKIDAKAAHAIAEHIGINHIIYDISEQDADFKDIEIVRAVLMHNNGGYHVNNNDVRKREFFRNLLSNGDRFDVEIKSWVSEIARANYYKKFGLKKMPKHLTPKHMMSMYKIFLWERKLAADTCAVFREYIDKTKFHQIPDGYDESDMYLWEFRYSAWGGIVITSEHAYSYEIVIPYNNRILLNRMLQAPKQKRIDDSFHDDLIRKANSGISETGISITNWNETKVRMHVERLYFLINSQLPF